MSIVGVGSKGNVGYNEGGRHSTEGSCHSGNGSTNSLGKTAAPETDFILGVLHSFQGPV